MNLKNKINFATVAILFLVMGAGCYESKPADKKVAETVSSTPVVAQNYDSKTGKFNYFWPTKSKVTTQFFSQEHPAVDIEGKLNDPVYAAVDGMVERADCTDAEKGCYIILDHGSGVKTMYGHNTKLNVGVGDKVKKEQEIALMGNTGEVRGKPGVHLHFEVSINGTSVDPMKLK